MSAASWKAAQIAAERAIPVLMAKGMLQHAAALARRARQFAERAAQ